MYVVPLHRYHSTASGNMHSRCRLDSLWRSTNTRCTRKWQWTRAEQPMLVLYICATCQHKKWWGIMTLLYKDAVSLDEPTVILNTDGWCTTLTHSIKEIFRHTQDTFQWHTDYTVTMFVSSQQPAAIFQSRSISILQPYGRCFIFFVRPAIYFIVVHLSSLQYPMSASSCTPLISTSLTAIRLCNTVKEDCTCISRHGPIKLCCSTVGCWDMS